MVHCPDTDEPCIMGCGLGNTCPAVVVRMDETIKRLRVAATLVDNQLQDGGVTARAHQKLAEAIASAGGELYETDTN